MKKKQLFAAAQPIAPAIFSRAARSLVGALLVLIFSQSTSEANDKVSPGVRPSPQAQTFSPFARYSEGNNIVVPFRPFSTSSKQALTDVTLLVTNSFSNDFDLMVYNVVTDEYVFVNIHPNEYQVPITVPEGTYDISFWPNDMGKYHHYYAIGCGPAGGGFGPKFFYGVSITAAMYCNYITIE